MTYAFLTQKVGATANGLKAVKDAKKQVAMEKRLEQ